MSNLKNPPTWKCDKCGITETRWGWPETWSRIQFHNLGPYTDKANPGLTYYGNQVDLCSRCTENLPTVEQVDACSRV